jgi:hypothetical protein
VELILSAIDGMLASSCVARHGSMRNDRPGGSRHALRSLVTRTEDMQSVASKKRRKPGWNELPVGSITYTDRDVHVIGSSLAEATRVTTRRFKVKG